MFDEIIISANTPSEYEYLNLPVFKDLYPDKGPLAGIYTSLINSSSFYTFMIACDMPFVELGLIKTPSRSYPKITMLLFQKAKKGLNHYTHFIQRVALVRSKKNLMQRT